MNLIFYLEGGRGSSDNDIRRRTASISTPHRASDVQVDPEQSAILFRDARGVSCTFGLPNFGTLLQGYIITWILHQIFAYSNNMVLSAG